MITMIALGPIERNSNGYSIRIGHLIDSLLRHDEVTLIEFHIAEPRGAGETDYKRIEYDAVYRNRRVSDLFFRLFTFNPLGQLKMQLMTIKGIWDNRALIRSSDMVLIEGALFPFAVAMAKLLGKTVILDTHCVNLKLGIDFKKHNRAAYILRCLTWGPLEYFAYRLSDHIIFVSQNEVDFSERMFHMPRKKAMVIPNVLDIPPLAVTAEETDLFRQKYGLNGKVVATFLGDLTSVQNKDCVNLILNELAGGLATTRKDIRFLIVGKGEEGFSEPPDNVVFTGYLDKIDAAIAVTDIFVAPMRVGAGTKTKVLLFMGYRKPILTTEVGIEGIDVRGRGDVMVLRIDEFADALGSFDPRTIYAGNEIGSCFGGDYSPEVMRSRVDELIAQIHKG
ncbi:MAG: glycosyltransferase family 4 protein [Methanomassiliicoccus sp.]|nr:glycosyltransferase family 4 protein [Methanomassiliicoccus sp.]